MVKFALIFCLLLNLTSLFARDTGSSSLGEALSQRKKTFMEKMPKEVIDLYEKNINDIKASGLTKKALGVGDKVPDVSVSLDGKQVPLSKIYGVGPVVLKFYRGGWCPYCMLELKHYETANKDFRAAGSQIIALAPDTAAEIRKTKTQNSLSYDIVGDDHQAIARKFGLVYKVDDKIVQSLKSRGIDLSVYQGHNDLELAIPATYVVGKDGRVEFAYVEADYRLRAEPSVVLKAVQSVKK